MISIRLRLTLWYSGVLLLGLALFSASTWFMLERRLMQGVDARLAQRAQGVRTLLEGEAAEENNDPNRLREELGEFARSTPEGGLLQVRENEASMLPVNSLFTNIELKTKPSKVLAYCATFRSIECIRDRCPLKRKTHRADTPLTPLLRPAVPKVIFPGRTRRHLADGTVCD